MEFLIMLFLVIVGGLIYLLWAAKRRKRTWVLDVIREKFENQLSGRGIYPNNTWDHGHFHPPGVAPEDIELVWRRIYALLQMILGSVLLIVDLPLSIYIGNKLNNGGVALFICIVVFIVGVWLVIYGGWV